MKYLLAILALTFSFASSFAQQQDPEMADVMRSNGKIYVVVTAIVIILVGLLVYLFLLDKKITRLERKIEDNR
ncbi:MAG TPA: CcmD family protein [Cyclobacteriaceae bacterium]|nr:CcmD family protein [Cyclobacteriaceae bacterium]